MKKNSLNLILLNGLFLISFIFVMQLRSNEFFNAQLGSESYVTSAFFNNSKYNNFFKPEFKVKENFPFVLDNVTFLQGLEDDTITGYTISDDGSIYLYGYTSSGDFPNITAYYGPLGGPDGFITKLFPNSQVIEYSILIGGKFADFIDEIAIGADGSLYLAGTTMSDDFPTFNAYNNTFSGNFNQEDLFVAKISADGQSLLFSTYIGGSKDDTLRDLALTSDGFVYLVGNTYSSNFPTVNAFNSTFAGISDGFITKLSPDGQNLLYSTFIGGSSFDRINSLFITLDNSILVIGGTSSTNFPIYDAYNSTFGGQSDSFVTKLSANGQNILFSTFIGGSNIDEAFFLNVDSKGNIFILGTTWSLDFPKTSYNTNNSIQFLTKLSGDNHQLIFSTLVPGLTYGFGFTIDKNGFLYILGYSINSTNFDGSITILTPNGENILANSTFGGEGDDFLTGIYIADENTIFLLGTTNSNFFLVNKTRYTFDTKNDGFLIKLNTDLDQDGMNTFVEIYYGLNPFIDDSEGDLDGDGISNIYEYQMGLNLTKNDAFEDLDGDGMPNLWEYKNGLFANSDDSQGDFDGDGLINLLEFQIGFSANENDNVSDSDHDGLPNLLEYQLGLSLDSDDSQGDLDGDGLPNFLEYQLGLSLDSDDSLGDVDNDGMNNLWEYQMGLNLSYDDSQRDFDGDWVSNIIEFNSGTVANDFWSFPFLYSTFPYLISIPSLIITSLLIMIGICISLLILFYFRKNLIRSLGAPDYNTAKKMKKGSFTDFTTYQKALSLDVSSQKEYEFALELEKELEESKLKQD